MARIRYGSVIKDKAIKALVKALTTIGWQVAMEAYRRKTYTNRTFNLHDSYGSAVYVDGKLVPDSVKYVNRARATSISRHGHNIVEYKGKGHYERLGGRAALMRFFKQHWIVRKKDRVTLVVAAAMWYGDIVESKGYVVLDEEFVKNAVSQRIGEVLPQVLAKYPELKGLEPTLRRWVGIDEVYAYDL